LDSPTLPHLPNRRRPRGETKLRLKAKAHVSSKKEHERRIWETLSGTKPEKGHWKIGQIF